MTLASTIEGHGPPLVLLHGLGSSRSVWQPVVPALAEDFTPISDMRASADIRLFATQNLLRRFWMETTGEAPETVYTYGR